MSRAAVTSASELPSQVTYVRVDSPGLVSGDDGGVSLVIVDTQVGPVPRQVELGAPVVGVGVEGQRRIGREGGGPCLSHAAYLHNEEFISVGS